MISSFASSHLLIYHIMNNTLCLQNYSFLKYIYLYTDNQHQRSKVLWKATIHKNKITFYDIILWQQSQRKRLTFISESALKFIFFRAQNHPYSFETLNSAVSPNFVINLFKTYLIFTLHSIRIVLNLLNCSVNPWTSTLMFQFMKMNKLFTQRVSVERKLLLITLLTNL